MRMNYVIKKNNNTGYIHIDMGVTLDSHIIKLIDYATMKLCKQSFSGALDDPDAPVKAAVYIDSEAILKWLSKLPEWAAFKLKVSNPLTLRVFRNNLEEKYRELLKKYKIPENKFVTGCETWTNKDLKDLEK